MQFKLQLRYIFYKSPDVEKRAKFKRFNEHEAYVSLIVKKTNL